MKGYGIDLSTLRTSRNAKQYFKKSIELEDGETQKATHFKGVVYFEKVERKMIGVTISNHGRYDDETIKISDNTSEVHEKLGFKPKFNTVISSFSNIINEICFTY